MSERTQVAIIGGGPAGLLLSHMLHLGGIDSVLLERQTKAYVLKRIRAGVLEDGTARLLRDAGLGQRMDQEGHVHDGSWIVWQDREPFLINTRAHCGKPMISHGQTAITEELYRVRERDGGSIVEVAENVRLEGVTGAAPKVTYEKHGETRTLACDFIAGCDGFHGVSRRSIPPSVLRTFERVYPFGWLGILSETPPVRRGDLCPARARLRAALDAQSNAQPLLHPMQPRRLTSTTGRTSGSGRSSSGACRPTIARKIVTGPSIEKASPRCAASSRSRCASAGFFWPATPRISCRRPAPRA